MTVFRNVVIALCVVCLCFGFYLMNQQSVSFSEKRQLLQSELELSQIGSDNIETDVKTAEANRDSTVEAQKFILDEAQSVVNECVRIQNDINRNAVEYEECTDSAECDRLMDEGIALYNEMWNYTDEDGLVKAWLDIDPTYEMAKTVVWTGKAGKNVVAGRVPLFFFLDESVDDRLLYFVFVWYDPGQKKIVGSTSYATNYEDPYSYEMHNDMDADATYEDLGDVGMAESVDDFLDSVNDVMNAPVWSGWSDTPMNDEESDAYSNMLDARDAVRSAEGW